MRPASCSAHACRHPDLARRQRAHAHGVLRCGHAARSQPKGERADPGLSHEPKPSSCVNAGSSSIKFQLFAVRSCATSSSGASRDRSKASARALDLLAKDTDGEIAYR